MKDIFEDDETQPEQNSRNGNHHANQSSNPKIPADGPEAKTAHGPWMAVDMLMQNWMWLVPGTLLGAALCFLLGWVAIKPKYTAAAQLLRFETAGDFFKPSSVSSGTFADLIRSPDLLKRVGEHANPPIPAETLIKRIKIDAERSSDVVNVQLVAREPEAAVELLNFYLQQAVQATKEMQAAEAAKVANDYLKKQVDQMDKDIKTLHTQFHAAPEVNNKLVEIGGQLTAMNQNLTTTSANSAITAKQTERLQIALGELNELMLKYTDIHPAVEAKREQIAALKKEIASSPANAAAPASPAPQISSAPAVAAAPAVNPELDLIRTKILSLEQARVQLSNRQREAAMFAANPPGMISIFSQATAKTVESNMRSVKITAVAIFGALLGFFSTIGFILAKEFLDNRLKTTEDVRRVTGLPVLTALGNMKKMKPHDQAQWAFRSWTLLQGRLSRSANHGLVCGFTSSVAGEGRSTWIRMLGEAASMTGFRVLTIATMPSPTDANGKIIQPPLLKEGEVAPEEPKSFSLATNVLNTPALVTDQLSGPDSPPVVHIPLPGWVWNLERRKQWAEALAHWRKIDNLVILVELPPASVPESVLLSSNVPNLVWLTDSGKAEAGETKAQLETLRHARCNLVGAVLNHEPSASVKNRFPRWVNCAALLCLLNLSTVMAQETNTTALTPAPTAVERKASVDDSDANTNVSFSVVRPAQRAAWQQKLTLGPGDILTFGLYGQPELTRSDVAIGPDGRVSYLEAQDVMAAGLTVDELRVKLNDEIGKSRRAVRTTVTPVAFHSKKYYMLGKVMTKGVYQLDRPITVLEAIARAHGLENGLIDRNIVDLADYQRSFLMRGGKRYPLDFSKLFQEGDLSQNIAIEPNDYLYFPSTGVKEIYVVGEVRLPGPVNYTPGMTIMGAISTRAGYTERAYKMRVLVVRGSVNHPQKIVVNTDKILSGKEPDFQLQSKDVIYVSARPFILAEELADLAITAFLQSLISSWVGQDIVRPLQSSE